MIFVLVSRGEERYMRSIYVSARPFVNDTLDPDSIRDSYIGLVLTPEIIQDDSIHYPGGAYVVRLEDVLTAMKTHNAEAYEYLCKKYQPLIEMADKIGKEILLPFRRAACEAVQ